jgi:LDH2 family malate/lactate/ureidoglycolate dehydrogenase
MKLTSSRFASKPMETWVCAILKHHHVETAAARDTARLLVRTSLRAIDTHGIARLPQYVERLKSGLINVQARPRVKDVHGALVCDGAGGLGQHVASVAMTGALQRAQTQALVGCTLRHCGHLAALGVIALEAAERGMVAILMQRTIPLLALPGYHGRAIGNNPLAFSMPVPDGPPVVFDMAMSEVAFGRIMEAHREGRSTIPQDWALDSEGQPTIDVEQALRGAMLPTGGHKGIGLAMLVECLAGSLSSSGGVDPGGFLLVVNPALLVGQQAFDQSVQEWLSTYRESAGVSGRYPGERQALSEVERQRDGIPIGSGLLQQLWQIANDAAIDLPQPLDGLSAAAES